MQRIYIFHHNYLVIPYGPVAKRGRFIIFAIPLRKKAINNVCRGPLRNVPRFAFWIWPFLGRFRRIKGKDGKLYRPRV